jgi:hypothetical protein
MLDRFKQMLKDAEMIISIREESLLEAKINAQFQPTKWNLEQIGICQNRLAKKVNFANVIRAKIVELETGVSQVAPTELTGETVQSSIQI